MPLVPLDMVHCWTFHVKTSLVLFLLFHSMQYLLKIRTLIHAVKHANVKHFENSKLHFIVPIFVIFLIQLQGWNNLADFKPETVGAEKLGMFSSKHGTLCHHPAFNIGLPYPTYVCRMFHYSWGFYCVLMVVVPDIENVLCILTMRQHQK